MDLPDWVEQLWGELRFRELAVKQSGQGYQDLFQKVMKSTYGDDFLDVRPVGKDGDFKCDGWLLSSATCHAVYGPFVQKSAWEVRAKIKSDLRGALAEWPEMREWRFVHNDQAGLSALVAKALISLREEVRGTWPRVTILPPWGPPDLWQLLRQVSVADRRSVIGFHGWKINQEELQEFFEEDGDPVSSSAGNSVAQLLEGFPAEGVVESLSATALAKAIVMFLLGDDDGFESHSSLLKRRCQDDPFEVMLTSIVFAVKSIDLWKGATGETPELWSEMMTHTGFSIPFIADMVLSAYYGIDPEDPVPGHPEDQQKVAIHLGQVAAMTLQLAASYRPDPLISVLQDFLISVQREPPSASGFV